MLTEKQYVEATELSEDVCCPLFDPARWDGIRHQWNSKLFLKDSVPEVFHIPLPGSYRRVISRMWKKAERAGAAPERDEFFLMSHDPSAFKGELYMAITREVPDGENVRLSGIFYSKVFEGAYNEVPRCISEMNKYLASRRLVSRKDYIYYPYCPKCAKKYGRNFIVVLAEVYEA